MTFKVITTGKNEFWGKKGRVKFLADSNLVYGLQKGFIRGNVEYLGNSKRYRGKHIPEEKVGLPVRKIDVLKQIEMQTKSHERILKELAFINKKRDEIKKLITAKNRDKSIGRYVAPNK